MKMTLHCQSCIKPTLSVGRLRGQSRQSHTTLNGINRHASLKRNSKKILITHASTDSEALGSPENPAPKYTKVLVTGSTGGTGQSVVKQLIDMGLDVKAMTRDAKRAKGVLPAGVTIAEGDLFSYVDAAQAVEGADAIVICSGPTSRMDPFSPFKVDFQGNENLVAAAKASGVKKIVMVSSIGADDPLFPLNLFGGVLVMKKLGELCLQRSNIDYTIIRPGGLKDQEKSAEPANPVVGKANEYGLPPRKMPGSILRSKVAEACIAALTEPDASNKVIELISEKGAPAKSWKELFATIS
jgi:uncharacterized protein YbjT (DUF2867 family)